MKKLCMFIGFMLLFAFTSSIFASGGVNIGSLSVAKDGLVFDSIMIVIDSQKMQGNIVFNPENPVATPANLEEPFLAPANTLAVFKKKLAASINKAIKTKKIMGYKTIKTTDIVVYGGPYVNSINSFTDFKVIEAMPSGVPYRVTVTLSPINKKDIVQTVIEGDFTVYTPEGYTPTK